MARQSQAGARLVLRAGSCGARCSTVSRRGLVVGKSPLQRRGITSCSPSEGTFQREYGAGWAERAGQVGTSAHPGFLGRDLSWMLEQEGAGSLPWQLPRGCKQPSIVLLRALGAASS